MRLVCHRVVEELLRSRSQACERSILCVLASARDEWIVDDRILPVSEGRELWCQRADVHERLRHEALLDLIELLEHLTKLMASVANLLLKLLQLLGCSSGRCARFVGDLLEHGEQLL